MAAPNSTWRQVTDEVLGLCRLRKIGVDSIFDAVPSQLNSVQAAGKAYVSFCHQLMAIKATQWFNTAIIQLPIDNVTPNATFNLDTGIHPDALKPISFFNATAGDSNARLLELWSNEYFQSRFPDPSIITSGPPEAVVLLEAPRGTNNNPQWQVRIYPNPDTLYNLTYKAKLSAQQLQLSTDQILWPYEYQTQITAYTWLLMEQGLGEGKDIGLREVAKKAVDDVKLVGAIAQEAKAGVRMFHAQARMTTSRLRYFRLDSKVQYGSQGFYIYSPLDPLPTQVPNNYWTLWGADIPN